MALDSLDRDQMLEVELVRNAEHGVAAMVGATIRRKRGPGGIAQGHIERLGVGLLLPALDVGGEGEFGERRLEPVFEVGAQGGAVERRGIGILADGLTLDEQALAGVNRFKRTGAPGNGIDLGRDAEQLGHEVLDERAKRHDEFAFRLGIQRVGCRTGRHQAFV